MSDFKGALFPKPKRKKRKRLMNGYKDKAERVCKYCGRPYAERHELFYGPLRQTSIEFGFQIDVCSDHHRWLHSAEPSGVEERDRLRAETERKYIEDLMTDGCTLEEAVEAWMQIIGKNYCEEINP